MQKQFTEQDVERFKAFENFMALYTEKPKPKFKRKRRQKKRGVKKLSKKAEPEKKLSRFEQVLKHLKEAGKPLTVTQLADKLKTNRNNAYQIIYANRHDKRLKKVDPGVYELSAKG